MAPVTFFKFMTCFVSFWILGVPDWDQRLAESRRRSLTLSFVQALKREERRSSFL